VYAEVQNHTKKMASKIVFDFVHFKSFGLLYNKVRAGAGAAGA
jgi:hypothetical protein